MTKSIFAEAASDALGAASDALGAASDALVATIGARFAVVVMLRDSDEPAAIYNQVKLAESAATRTLGIARNACAVHNDATRAAARSTQRATFAAYIARTIAIFAAKNHAARAARAARIATSEYDYVRITAEAAERAADDHNHVNHVASAVIETAKLSAHALEFVIHAAAFAAYSAKPHIRTLVPIRAGERAARASERVARDIERTVNKTRRAAQAMIDGSEND